jgi:hypothetical protein
VFEDLCLCICFACCCCCVVKKKVRKPKFVKPPQTSLSVPYLPFLLNRPASLFLFLFSPNYRAGRRPNFLPRPVYPSLDFYSSYSFSPVGPPFPLDPAGCDPLISCRPNLLPLSPSHRRTGPTRQLLPNLWPPPWPATPHRPYPGALPSRAASPPHRARHHCASAHSPPRHPILSSTEPPLHSH